MNLTPEELKIVCFALRIASTYEAEQAETFPQMSDTYRSFYEQSEIFYELQQKILQSVKGLQEL